MRRSPQRTVPVNGADLCVQTFGDVTNPAILLPLDRVGHEMPPRALWDQVVAAILDHTATG